MEVLGETENRYSGIPTMRRELARAGMPEPDFWDERGTFVVCFRKARQTAQNEEPDAVYDYDTTVENLLHFCVIPRTRREIAKFLGIKSVAYAVTTYVTPLVEKGMLTLSLPEKPRSPKQRYTAAGRK